MESSDTPQSSYVTMPPQPSPVKRRLGWLLVVGTIVVLLAGGASLWKVLHSDKQSLNTTPSATISLDSDGYTPATVKVKPGQYVMWVNKDAQDHQVVADQALLPDLHSEGPLKTGESYSFPFEKKGSYTFYDPANPDKYKGTVVVE
jgi:plastocyanin